MLSVRLGFALAVTTAAGNAAARGPALHLSFSATAANAGPWLPNIEAHPGETVFVRVEMSIPATFYGIAGARYNITSTNVQGWDFAGNDTVDLTPAKGSTSDGRIAGFDKGGQTQQVFESANSLRIDAKGDTGNNPNAGISTSHGTPGALGTHFNTNKEHVPVYKFAIHLSNNPMYNRQLVLSVLTSQITSFKAYATSNSTSGTDIPNPVGDSGTITIIPAPSALLLAGCAVPIRRRR